jgi:hypothetical protein
MERQRSHESVTTTQKWIMNMHYHRATAWRPATLLALAALLGSSMACAAQPAPLDDEAGVEVLTRGPVHEAFVETVTFDPEPGIVVPEAPPEAIEELPPDQRPEGDNVAWIPGYWAWDDEREDFLWVSGIWRALPPGRQWVSGYWGESGPDFQWTSGYWADALASEVEYLPQPPQTVEVGPNIDAPSADHAWLPGCWVWRETRYAWRPGYWATAQPNWVWIPAYYVWSPRGYVFVEGYWDHAIDQRGILFAPVYFSANVYAQPGYSYSPATVINPGVFSVHLFLRPRYGHYYFGDYYAKNYDTAGFHRWSSFHNRRGYDPIHAHDRWRHRDDQSWEQHRERDYRRRRDDEHARPPRNLAAQRQRATTAADTDEANFVVAAPLEQVAKSQSSPLRFRPVEQAERRKIADRGREVRQWGTERRQRETAVADTANDQPAADRQPVRVKLPPSPIAAKPAEELGEGQAPPATQAGPDPDPSIEPKPRTSARNPRQPPEEPSVTEDQPTPEGTNPRRPARNRRPPQAGTPETSEPSPTDAPKPRNRAGRRAAPQPGAPPAGEPSSTESPEPRTPADDPQPPQADTPGPKPKKPVGNDQPPQAETPAKGNQPPTDAPKPRKRAGKRDAPQPGAPSAGAPSPSKAPKPKKPAEQPKPPQVDTPAAGNQPPPKAPKPSGGGGQPQPPQNGPPPQGGSQAPGGQPQSADAPGSKPKD